MPYPREQQRDQDAGEFTVDNAIRIVVKTMSYSIAHAADLLIFLLYRKQSNSLLNLLKNWKKLVASLGCTTSFYGTWGRFVKRDWVLSFALLQILLQN